MSSARRTLKTLAALLPLGALGISSALASTPASARDSTPAVAAQGSALEQPGVAERLAAIRAAVSEITGGPNLPQAGEPGIQRLAWHNWGNFGPWFNGGWKNWGNGWHNGGWNNWGNGWHNGGWKNFWANW
ncbi:MAG: GrrA/OscA1 family cyclophane-containing rSAM-modified RiPP [Dongiaceae bacterium]